MIGFKDELEFKRAVAAALQVFGWQTQEHEDSVGSFIPDLSFSANFVSGWIEVKYCHKPPKTLGAIKHYTKGQEDWLVRHGRAGSGHCYLLVGTPEESRLARWDALSQLRDRPWVAAAPLCKLVVAHPAGDAATVAAVMDRTIRLRDG